MVLNYILRTIERHHRLKYCIKKHLFIHTSLRKICTRQISLQSALYNICAIHRLYANHSFSKPRYKHSSSVLIGAFVSLSMFGCALSSNIKAEKAIEAHPEWQSGDRKATLPTYTRNKVKQHNTEHSLWLTYRNGVYDLTAFTDEHPGAAQRLLLATNGNHDIAMWWEHLGYHNVQDVHQLLETFRIGNVSENEVIECEIKHIEIDPILKKDRNAMYDTAFSYEPFIAETPIQILHKYYYTPIRYHYVRNHYSVPLYLDWDSEFTISGIGINDDEYTLKYKDILSLPTVTKDVYLQCGGHRRIEYNIYGKTKGSKWNIGAIGNGKYKGVLLRDVLKYIGVDVDTLYNNGNNNLNVWFLGADCGPDGEPYAVSIPLYKALDPNGDVMLAYQHNDEPLTHDHGYPVRVIVPGWIAARSVKWIEQIIIAKEECDITSYTKSYKMTKDMKQEIRALPVNSAIHSPQYGDNIKLNKDNILHIAGEAHSGDGNAIVRVDVSVDGGETWNEAMLCTKQQLYNKNWAWIKWQCDVDITPYIKTNEDSVQLHILCRAVDLSYNRQPSSCKDDLAFNPKGYAANPYHSVNVSVYPSFDDSLNS